MPRNTREWARRELDRAHDQIDWPLAHLGRVQEVYESAHPEIADPLLAVSGLLVQCQDAIKAIKDTF